MTKTPDTFAEAWLQDILHMMEEEMVLRGFTRETRRTYRAHVRRFYEGRGWRGAHDQVKSRAENDEVRQWLLHLMRAGKSHSYTNQALSALRFLHKAVLKEPAPVAGIPRAKKKKALPKVLSKEEIKRFLEALDARNTEPSPSFSTREA